MLWKSKLHQVLINNLIVFVKMFHQPPRKSVKTSKEKVLCSQFYYSVTLEVIFHSSHQESQNEYFREKQDSGIDLFLRSSLMMLNANFLIAVCSYLRSIISYTSGANILALKIIRNAASISFLKCTQVIPPFFHYMFCKCFYFLFTVQTLNKGLVHTRQTFYH